MSALSTWRARVGSVVDGPRAQRFIIGVIVLNAITLGLETSETAMGVAGGILTMADKLIVAIFVVELSLRLFAHGLPFFRNGWNIFDFLVVGITLVPATGNLSVLRTLRILRVLRLISIVPQMRKVVGALVAAIPGLGSIAALLLLVYYVAAVMATKLFGESFPDWFGTIGGSMFSLFQIMTLESWSMGIVRPVMEQYPQAWIFFIPFILVTSFAVLNLFIALIVNTMQEIQAKETEEITGTMHKEHREIEHEIDDLRHEIVALRKELATFNGHRRQEAGE
jgi:voltage-gated sodium channel